MKGKIMRSVLRITGLVVLGLVFLVGVFYLIVNPEREKLSTEVRDQVEGEFVSLSQGWVHYQLEGEEEAPTVVLVHGFSVPYYVWDPTYAALREKGFRVLRYDLYGRGFSDRPRVKYDLELFASQLDELTSALDLEKDIHVVGLSMGGPVAVEYAVDHPRQVQSVVLIAPQARSGTVEEVFPLNVPVIGELMMAVFVEPIILPSAQPDDFYQPEHFPDWEEKYRVQLQYKGFRRAILSTIRNLLDMDPVQGLQALEKAGIPVLLIWGEEDQSISREDMDRVRAILTEVEFHTVPEAGHLSHYERPAIVNPIISFFIEKNSSREQP